MSVTLCLLVGFGFIRTSHLPLSSDGPENVGEFLLFELQALPVQHDDRFDEAVDIR